MAIYSTASCTESKITTLDLLDSVLLRAKCSSSCSGGTTLLH